MAKEKIYEVLDNKKNKGLTVGSYSLPIGRKFSKAQWKFGEDALESAIKAGRCKVVGADKKEEKKNGGGGR